MIPGKAAQMGMDFHLEHLVTGMGFIPQDLPGLIGEIFTLPRRIDENTGIHKLSGSGKVRGLLFFV
jgi:hypothetical protein